MQNEFWNPLNSVVEMNLINSPVERYQAKQEVIETLLLHFGFTTRKMLKIIFDYSPSTISESLKTLSKNKLITVLKTPFKKPREIIVPFDEADWYREKFVENPNLNFLIHDAIVQKLILLLLKAGLIDAIQGPCFTSELSRHLVKEPDSLFEITKDGEAYRVAFEFERTQKDESGIIHALHAINEGFQYEEWDMLILIAATDCIKKSYCDLIDRPELFYNHVEDEKAYYFSLSNICRRRTFIEYVPGTEEII